jgi:hypothetical protein
MRADGGVRVGVGGRAWVCVGVHVRVQVHDVHGMRAQGCVSVRAWV